MEYELYTMIHGSYMKICESERKIRFGGFA